MPEMIAVRTLLEGFFGLANGNGLQLADLQSGGRFSVLGFLLEPLQRQEPSPTVLPRLSCEKPQVVDWYGIARTDTEFRRLSEELQAFVGPSYSTFRGRRIAMDPSDAAEAAVSQYTGGSAFRFRAAEPDEVGRVAVRKALDLMFSVDRRRLTRAASAPRSTGRILRDFSMALQAGNRTTAERFLRELRERERLDALNLYFLRIEMLVELGAYAEVLDLPGLDRIREVRRPTAATEGLLRALYRVELADLDAGSDKQAVNERWRALAHAWLPLLSSSVGMTAPDALRVFEIERASRRPHATALPNIGAELAEAERAFDEGRFGDAFDGARLAPVSVARARLLVRCAYEMQALESDRIALDALSGLADGDRVDASRSRIVREFLQREGSTVPSQVASQVPLPAIPPPLSPSAAAASPEPLFERPTPVAVPIPEPPPLGWEAWLFRVGRDPGWAQAVSVARLGGRQWSIDGFLEDPDGAARLAGTLQAPRTPAADRIVADAIPHLLAFLRRDPEWPRRELLPVYESMLLLLTAESQGGEDELDVITRLAEAILRLDAGARRYEDALRDARELWDRFAAPSRLDWLLGFLDELGALPCPVPAARAELLERAAAALRHNRSRTEADQLLLFRALAREAGVEATCPDLFASPRNASVKDDRVRETLAVLSGKHVAIYTLDEAAARRAKVVLEECAAGARVELAHDHVGGDRLAELARNADVFIVVTACAKHAATTFIERHRKERVIVRPRGKGTASILRDLRAYAASI